jgi:phenylalanyl-tRNA synthetase alpha chain
MENEMLDDINEIQIEIAKIDRVSTMDELEEARVRLIGRKGLISQLMPKLKDLSPEDKPKYGKELNRLKNAAEEALEKKRAELAAVEEQEVAVDYTLPGEDIRAGHIHIITRAFDLMLDILVAMGFEVVEGPELETEWHNFEALNILADHPARDNFDSLYVDPTHLLRSHTSPVQIRTMESRKPPIQIVAPGVCYRRDQPTARHSCQFTQIEMLHIDDGITFAHMKGVIMMFIRKLFGEKRKVRLRPDYFPFVEPGADVAMDCILCAGAGCRACSNTGWMEIMGAGMVHPFVLKNCGIDPERYTGFAFGLGVERVAMLLYGIEDIRLFTENDFRFLRQF